MARYVKPIKPAWSRNGTMPANDISEHAGSEPLPEALSLTAGRSSAFSRAHKAEQSSKHSGGDANGSFKDLYGQRVRLVIEKCARLPRRAIAQTKSPLTCRITADDYQFEVVAQCQTSKEDANRALVGASITFSIPSGTEV